jgi:hypothetical protein
VPYIALYGLWGTALLVRRVKNRVVQTTWIASTAAALLAFWLLGANIPANTLIAAHDIGALEYYYPHPFIDMAGLVSTEVIPFLRDQNHLREFLFARGAAFAIFFPDWYPALSSDSRFVSVHQTNCAVTRQAGETNMAVYRIVVK